MEIKTRTVLTPDETARFLKIKKAHLYDMCRKNIIPHKRVGQRFLRFNLDDLEKWLHEKN